MSRDSWDKYFIDMCCHAATRSTCDRKHVGSVIVRDNRVLSCGYNGSLPKQPHCDDVGHDMFMGSCRATVHSEANSVATAARMGICVDGATLYCNFMPCWDCFKVIVSSGIKRIVYHKLHGTDYGKKVILSAQSCGISLEQYHEETATTTPAEYKRDLITYLAGPMEFTHNYTDWRDDLQIFFAAKNINVINPAIEEQSRGFKCEDMKALRESNFELFKDRAKQVIQFDLKCVSRSDFIVCRFEGEKVFGTAGELTYAFLRNIPIFLITGLPQKDIPIWLTGCVKRRFQSIEDFKNNFDRISISK